MNEVKKIMQQAAALADDELITQPLKQQGSWPECVHLLNKKSLLAIAAALGAQRPLLIRGEPGTGKSHLARAAAALLERHFISTVVQPYTEYQELLWTFDHTQRLADAQLMSLSGDAGKPVAQANKQKTPIAELLAPSRYTSPGPLWYAYDWIDASKQICKTAYQPEPTEDNKAPDAQVLLIDEIDKADISLSNGLLEVLGNRSFRVPHRAQAIGGGKQTTPLVILTSNSIRELPSALLRRCVLLDLSLPTGKELISYFVKVGRAHFPLMDDKVLTAAAEQICDDREQQAKHSLKTGQAEYVDLLRAVQNSGKTVRQQQDSIEHLANFFFKHQAND